MPNELEYIVDKAVVVCDNGAKPNFFNATNNQKVKISGCKVSIASDKAPLVNIPEFGICALTNKPCVPAPTEWQDTYKVKVNGEQTLLYKSKLPCSAGGMITFSTSGQVPLSQEDLDEMVEQHGEDPEESSWGWWDTAELIPVVGSVIGMVREANKGNWGMVALNAGFLVLDVLGFVSFGATTAVATTAKTGVKAGIKATAKKTIQTAMKTAKNATTKILGKQGIKTAAKALATKVDDIAKAHGKICIFACFPAGTPVHTQSGIKNIEDIQIGDRVWAYDEETEQVQLQRVTATFEREVDATLQIVLEGEVIETTAEHPFYTQQGWKDAGDLTTIDRIKTQNHQWQRIKGHNFLYQTKKVYNFEVENWHTYFVGENALLVHNSPPCVSSAITNTAEQLAKSWDDLGKLMHCFTGATLVKTIDGYLPIEQIKVGEKVSAFDLSQNKETFQEVLEVYQNTATNIVRLFVDNELIECTPSHKFWVVEQNDWIPAIEICEGDTLLDLEREVYSVKKIEYVEGDFVTYNLEVENHHNYFVSSLDILVHNGNPFPNSIFNDLTERFTEIYRYYDASGETLYVGKTVQGLEKRASQHAKEKMLQELVKEDKLFYEVIADGKWTPFQTAAHEQHFMAHYKTKGRKGTAAIWNRINALSKKKFDYFSKLIGCGKINMRI